MTKNDGGPAFPGGEKYTTTDLAGNKTDRSKGPLKPGMSLRDWFAGQAMKGFAPRIYDQGYPQEPSVMEVMWAARAAYVIADAMLVEREADHAE